MQFSVCFRSFSSGGSSQQYLGEGEHGPMASAAARTYNEGLGTERLLQTDILQGIALATPNQWKTMYSELLSCKIFKVRRKIWNRLLALATNYKSPSHMQKCADRIVATDWLWSLVTAIWSVIFRSCVWRWLDKKTTHRIFICTVMPYYSILRVWVKSVKRETQNCKRVKNVKLRSVKS